MEQKKQKQAGESPKSINIKDPEKLKKMIEDLPEGTVLSLQIEVVLRNE